MANEIRLRRWVFQVLAGATLVLTPCQGRAGARGTAEEARAGVVKITATFGGDSAATKHGFGFVAGERDGFLYIATANHVVRSDTDDTPAASTKVQFFSDQGLAYPATVLETHRAAPLDLAVIKIARPASSPGSALCDDSRMIRRDMPVAYVGRDGDWYVPTGDGTVNSDAPDEGLHIAVDFSRTVAVKEGTSGAPLVSERGLLGMIVQDSNSNVATVLTTEAIARAFQHWQHPWAARICSPPPPPVPDHGFEVGLRLGYGQPFGEFSEGNDSVASKISPSIPLVLEGGYHLVSPVIVGALFQYSDLGLTFSGCDYVGAGCHGSQMLVGVFGRYRYLLNNRFQLWGGLGAGYEWFSIQGQKGTFAFKGFEVTRFEIGGDLLAKRRITIGPFVSLSLSRFEWGRNSLAGEPDYVNLDASGGSDLRRWHEWLMLGVRTSIALVE